MKREAGCGSDNDGLKKMMDEWLPQSQGILLRMGLGDTN